eukprot:GFUD01038377.1.p1 GENE.GFUD01038377.1~~GFUD01038377.1.p1  ORF type:complete len:429 (+),score=123.62 GFUD01038377.1:34-1320(+)
MLPPNSSVLVLCLLACSGSPAATRVTLVQQQACNYQADTREVLCQCREEDTMAYLGIRMQWFVKQAGREISSLVVQSCSDLILNLDLRGLNLNQVQTIFRNCETVRIESVILDTRLADTESLRMEFYRIGIVTLSGVQVDSAIQMTVTNVRKFQLLASSFAHLPTLGLVVNGSAKVQIRDCVFEQIQAQSIVVERTRELEMVGNQFGESGERILSYRDSSSTLIRCNRVVGSAASPGCSLSSQTESVASTDTTQVYTRYQYRSVEELRAVGEEGDWLVIISGAALLFSIVIYTSYMSYNNQEVLIRLKNDLFGQIIDYRSIAIIRTVEGNTLLEQKTIPEPPPPPEPVEMETMFKSKTIANGKIQVLAPVWLSEIQSNEIFNKQKKSTQDGDNTEELESEEAVKTAINTIESLENGSKDKKGFKEYMY